MSCIRLLLMIHAQILVSDLHKGHLVSDDIIWAYQQIFADNSQLERATGMGLASLCSSYQGALPDMRHDLLGSTCDLKWSWPVLKFWPDLSRSTSICFDTPWWEERDGIRIMLLAFFIQKMFAEDSYFDVLWPCSPQIVGTRSNLTAC